MQLINTLSLMPQVFGLGKLLIRREKNICDLIWMEVFNVLLSISLDLRYNLQTRVQSMFHCNFIVVVVPN